MLTYKVSEPVLVNRVDRITVRKNSGRGSLQSESRGIFAHHSGHFYPYASSFMYVLYV